MVGRRDAGHRGQGDVRHGNISSDMHKNQNEHMLNLKVHFDKRVIPNFKVVRYPCAADV